MGLEDIQVEHLTQIDESTYATEHGINSNNYVQSSHMIRIHMTVCVCVRVIEQEAYDVLYYSCMSDSLWFLFIGLSLYCDIK